MFAIVQGVDGPSLKKVPIPDLGVQEVRVKVSSCGLNRVDLLMARGKKHGTAGGHGSTLGREWAGIINAVGSDVPQSLQPGQRVMGAAPGSFAEYVNVHWERVIPVPERIVSLDEAACLPIALQTMHDALVTCGHFRSGQTVLIHGASSGVGLMGIQIARYLGAGKIVASSTQAWKRQRLVDFGVDLAIDSTDVSWVDSILDVTSGRGVDVVLDMVSGNLVSPTMRATALEGRIVNIGRLGGAVSSFDFDLHALRRINYVGATFRTRTEAEIRKIVSSMKEGLSDGLRSGQLVLPIDQCFELGRYDDALQYMATNQHFGKIILKVSD